ncbi:MAG: hypothetical protein OEV36_02290 [Myxococcales bacterium]|nr:hypothetical protein [Myxococcales bacterium]
MLQRLRVCVFVALSLGAQAGPAAAQGATPPLPVLVMLAGGGARARNIHLEVGDGERGTAERTFETGLYFDFGWHLLVRPMGRRAKSPALQALVLQMDGGAGIGLQAEPAGSGISLWVRSWRLLGQLGYLYPLGRLQVGGLVGVGADVLRIASNRVLTSSRLVYVRVGPAATYDWVPSFLVLRLDLGIRVPFVFGELQDAFGRDSSGVGLDAAATIGGRLDRGFTYALRFVWAYYRLRFAGPVMNVPAMAEGGRGNDHALTLQVLIGWSL